MPKIGYRQTEEHKKKLSEAKMGNTIGLGHKETKEHKERISKANQGKHKRGENSNWRGGIYKDKDDYLLFKVPEGCKFSSMKNNCGYIRMSRLVMAEYLQRSLTDKEVVHHINGNVRDNNIENLKLFKDDGEHTAHHNKN
ncbi:MAG: HNH endonuclease [Candidatus Atribacteria bacterium]|nr:HNH endonuclease [Candidatus Atribacteria bacterium]